MPRRQLQVFTIGCWAALGLAAVHLVGYLAGIGSPAGLEARVVALLDANRLPLPGGGERSLVALFDGFSFAYAVLLASWGGVGLAVCRRAADPALLYAVARTMAGGAILLLAVSLRYWFLVSSIPVALLAVSFSLAAVRAPDHETS